MLLFVVGALRLFAQTEVDEVRLVYDPDKLNSKQVAFSITKDGSLIAFAFDDGTIRIMDPEISKFIHRSTLTFTDIFDIRFLDKNSILVLSKGTTAQIIQWKTGKTIQRLSVTGAISYCEISNSGNLIAIGDRKGNVLVWDAHNGKEKLRFQPFRKNIYSLAFHPDGQHLLIYGAASAMASRGPVSIFDINTGRKVQDIDKMYILGFAKYDDKGERIIYQGQTQAPKILYDAYFQKTHLKVYHLAQNRIVSKSKVGFSLKANVFTDAIFYNNVFLGVTLQNAFEVRDIYSGERLFSTLRDDSKLFAGLTLRNRIYPLSKPGYFLVNYNHASGKQHNMNLIFDANIMEIVGYVYTDSNEDFAIISRDGRSYGTASAFEKVFWSSRGSSKRVSLESSSSAGFTPRLFSQLIESSVPENVFEVDNFIADQPKIFISSVGGKPIETQADSIIPEITSMQKNIQVSINIASRPDKIDRVKLFQNSKLIGVIDNDGTIDKEEYLFEVTLTNSLGDENYFYAVAMGRSGLDSEKEKFVIHYSGATDESPNLYLFTIGINAYKNPKYNLNYANADADAFGNTIVNGATPIFTRIHNYELRDDEASRKNMLLKLKDIQMKAREQDMFIFYYAGHGAMSTDPNEQQEFYLIPFDVTQIYGNTEDLKQVALSASDIREASISINAQKQVYILDACQSAGLLETVTVRGMAEEKAIAQLARSTGTFWITSTGTEQYATEFDKLGHGVFTYSLLEGISGKADGGQHDQKITVRELVTYVEDRVPQLTEQYKGQSQYPTTFSFGNDFPLVIVKGGIE